MNGNSTLRPKNHPRSTFVVPLLLTWFYAIYPILALFTHNADELSIRQLVLPMTVAIILSTFIFATGLLILRNPLKSGLASLIVLLILWNYGDIYGFLNPILSLRHWHLIPIIIFLTAHVVYLIARPWNHETLWNLNLILFIPLTLLISYNGFRLGSGEVKKNLSLRKTRNAINSTKVSSNPNQRPDIFYIILDEFAPPETMAREFDYDNAGLNNFLKDLGFYVAENSKTRYLSTLWILTGIFNLDYVTKPVDQSTILDFFYNKENIGDDEKYKMLVNVSTADLINKMSNNYLTSYLKKQGYQISVCEGYPAYRISNADHFITYNDISKTSHGRIMYDPFHSMLYQRSILFVLEDFRSLDESYHSNYSATNYFFNYLEKEAPLLKGPKFIYAHLMLPHSPFVFDRDGNPITPVMVPNDNRPECLTLTNNVNYAYLDQYIYATTRIKQTIRKILQTSASPPIIILQSDHGPRPHQVYLKDRHLAFNVLNAVYFPDGNYKEMYNTIATVNTFRLLLNKYFNGNYKMLEDN